MQWSADQSGTFSCMFVDLSVFIFVSSCDSLGFFIPRNTFAAQFGSIYICTGKQRLISFPAFGWNIPLYTSEILLPLLSAVTSLRNTSDSVWLAAIRFLPVEPNCVVLFGLPVSVTSGLDLVVNPLQLHLWRCLSVVDLDNNDLFFSTIERILSSCTLVILCGLSDLLVLLSAVAL